MCRKLSLKRENLFLGFITKHRDAAEGEVASALKQHWHWRDHEDIDGTEWSSASSLSEMKNVFLVNRDLTEALFSPSLLTVWDYTDVSEFPGQFFHDCMRLFLQNILFTLSS